MRCLISTILRGDFRRGLEEGSCAAMNEISYLMKLITSKGLRGTLATESFWLRDPLASALLLLWLNQQMVYNVFVYKHCLARPTWEKILSTQPVVLCGSWWLALPYWYWRGCASPVGACRRGSQWHSSLTVKIWPVFNNTCGLIF